LPLAGFILVGCQAQPFYQESKRCVIIPEGYVLSDVQYDGKTAYWIEECPKPETEIVAASSGSVSSSSMSASGAKSPSGARIEPKTVVERSVAGGGKAEATQIEVPVPGERKVSVVAGGITIFEDGSVQMPRMGLVE